MRCVVFLAITVPFSLIVSLAGGEEPPRGKYSQADGASAVVKILEKPRIRSGDLIVGKWKSKPDAQATTLQFCPDGTIKRSLPKVFARDWEREEEFEIVGRYERNADGVLVTMQDSFAANLGIPAAKYLWINVQVTATALRFDELPYKGEKNGLPNIDVDDALKFQRRTYYRN